MYSVCKQVGPVPNIGFTITISSTTEVQTQHFGKLMAIQYETRWCQRQIFVLAPRYPLLPNYTPSTSENSYVFSLKTGGARCQILVLAPQYPALPKYTPSTSESSSVFSVKTGGASTKNWTLHHNTEYYLITPPALRKTHMYSV